MDRRASHSHGVAAGNRARCENGRGARQQSSSVSCWYCASGALGRPAAPLTVLLQPRTSRRRAPGDTWLPDSTPVPLGPGLPLAEGHLRGGPAGLGEHWHTPPALGPSLGSSVPFGKTQSMAMFLFAPQREKIKNNRSPHHSPNASCCYNVMLLLSLLSCCM